MSDGELLERQATIQAQAADVIADLDLSAPLGSVCMPVNIGRSAWPCSPTTSASRR